MLTSTDVAALYGKCTQVTLRNYGAYTTKVDYMKEVAARVVIAAAIRSVGGSTVPCISGNVNLMFTGGSMVFL